jgi:hypothetical protein
MTVSLDDKAAITGVVTSLSGMSAIQTAAEQQSPTLS